MSEPRLLVVVPHATRTGSTKVLLDLLRGLAPLLDDRLAVEVRADGARRDELEAFGGPLAAGEEPGALLVNSSLAADAVLQHAAVPAAVYVHETAEVLAELPGPALEGLRRARRVLCVSAAVATDVQQVGVEPERVVIVPPVVQAVRPGAAAIDEARRALGLDPTHRLVVGCGEATRRKGTDVFVEVAARLAGDDRLRFAWIGRRLLPYSRQLDLDARRGGLGSRLRWPGDLADALPVLAAAEVVVMPSRHDPLPLVPLEAALVGTPTVGFDLGGLAELAAAGAIDVAPYPDSVELARLVRRLLDEPDRGAELVDRGRDRVAERQAPGIVLPLVAAELRGLLASDEGSASRRGPRPEPA